MFYSCRSYKDRRWISRHQEPTPRMGKGSANGKLCQDLLARRSQKMASGDAQRTWFPEMIVRFAVGVGRESVDAGTD